MRHGDKVVKLSRTTSHRKALLRNLSEALFKYEAIRTTLPKAKALRSFAEKLITKAKKDTVAARREVFKDIKKTEVLEKLFDDIALRYRNRNGGYTRIYKLGYRATDGSEMAQIELVEELLQVKGDEKKTEKTERKLEQKEGMPTSQEEKVEKKVKEKMENTAKNKTEKNVTKKENK